MIKELSMKIQTNYQKVDANITTTEEIIREIVARKSYEDFVKSAEKYWTRESCKCTCTTQVEGDFLQGPPERALIHGTDDIYT